MRLGIRHLMMWAGAILLAARLGTAQATGGACALHVSELGQPAGGWMTNGSVTILGGAPSGAVIRWTPGSRTITMTGMVSEDASIEVNGVPAHVERSTFTAEHIPIVEGPNLIVVSAADHCGNRSDISLTVFLSTKPPARPTLESPPALAKQARQTLSGTKTAGTSIWINGRQVVGLSEATTWTAAVALTGGDNALMIAAKDAFGNESASTAAHITVESAPPRIEAFEPRDGSIVRAGSAVTIQARAIDPDGDPVAYQVSIDGAPLGEWSSAETQTWTPAIEQLGRRTVMVRARDDYGGLSVRTVEVFVVRTPVQHP